MDYLLKLIEKYGSYRWEDGTYVENGDPEYSTASRKAHETLQLIKQELRNMGINESVEEKDEKETVTESQAMLKKLAGIK